MAEETYRRIAIAIMTPEELSGFCKDFGQSENSNHVRLVLRCRNETRIEIDFETRDDCLFNIDMFRSSLKNGMLQKWGDDFVVMTAE